MHLAVVIGNSGILRLLQIAAANVSLQNKDGDTVLHLAAKLGKNDCLKQLLNQHTPEVINTANKAGESALHCAVLAENHHAIDLLLEFEADVNCKVTF